MSKRKLTLFGFVGVAALISCDPSVRAQEAPQTQPAADKPGPLLSVDSVWRAHLTLRTPLVGPADTAQPRASLDMWADAEFPPADWTAPGFDDSSWLRASGPQFVGAAGGRGGRGEMGRFGFGQKITSALLCLRGRFVVDEPAGMESLSFTAEYRGGIVVYLNGVEVARGHMPEGPIAPATLAQSYPRQAYFDSTDQPLTLEYCSRLLSYPNSQKIEQEVRDRLNLRIRRLPPTALPATLLRKGVNVLAIEIHRVSDHPDFKIDSRGGHSYIYPGWGSVSLCAAELAGRTPDAARPPVVPNRLYAWNCSILERVWRDEPVWSPEPLAPIRIVGARTGGFSGQLVIGSPRPIRGLACRISDLAAEGGPAGRVIPADSVAVHYPSPWPASPPRRSDCPPPPGPALLDMLMDSPPTTAPTDPGTGWAVQSVWLTVKVPPQAAPGRYKGQLTVTAADCPPIEAPVTLDVAGFVLPDPRNMTLHVDMVQFPESLALQYGVQPWSARHFDLVAKSLRLAGRTGNKVVYIPLICGTLMSNRDSMVRWVPRPDGGFTYDYSPAERYLDLVEQHMGRPQVVCLWVWGPHLGIGARRLEDELGTVRNKVAVTRLDPLTGQSGQMIGPAYDEPAATEFWRPVIEGLMDRLARRGLDKAVLLGVLGDSVAQKEVLDCWGQLLPKSPWKVVAHHPVSVWRGRPVAHRAQAVFDVWCGSEERANRPAPGWQNPWSLMHCRSLELYAPLTFAQAQGELAVQSGFGGVGWMTADFWPELAKRGRYMGGGDVYGRTLFDQNPVLGIGPGGAVSTVRREVFWEGVQLAEARIFLDKALSDERTCAVLGAQLADRYRSLLADRARRAAWSCAGYNARLRPIHSKYHTTMEVPRDGIYWHISSDWQDRSLELFQAAAEVQQATVPPAAHR